VTTTLKVTDLNVYYGKSHALQGVSLEVKEGEVVALLGANGAGKTSTLRTISGLVKPTSGKIEFQGTDITGMAPDRIVAMGLIHVPQGRRVFPKMTVLENLEMGALLQHDRKVVEQDLEVVYELFPILAERKKQLAGTLSGGEQQMLAVARGLMGKPRLLMMDEPSMGLAPVIVAELFDKIEEISKTGVTILLVEQNAVMALSVTNRAYFLETGRITLTGNAKELLDSDLVAKAYLS
jgi:branched-chain amino acid transport system ATP-binding protein